MRCIWLSLLVLGLFACFAIAFEQIDHEIFELQDELRKQEGPESSLYKLLGVGTGDKVKKITRAYRKLSLEVHPDKDLSDKATKRFALLNNAHKILKDKHARERYDFFLKNGFPVWRGTGYMYSRHRPGVLFAVLFVLIVGSGTQYLVQQISYVRTKDRIAYVIEEYSKSLSSRDARKLQQQVSREPGTSADPDILPPELDASLLKKPTVWDVTALKCFVSLGNKFGLINQEKAELKVEKKAE